MATPADTTAPDTFVTFGPSGYTARAIDFAGNASPLSAAHTIRVTG
jgi:hypothetical protein